MKKLIALALACASLPLSAEPTSEEVKIVTVRPYLNEGGGPADIFVHTDRPVLCNTNIFVIRGSWGGAKEATTAAYAALLTGRSVKIEIHASGCANPGWQTQVQSIYLL
ncbi:hypothetical protein OU995_09760 [Roseateles sp. SL47]|uniref:hypothetical protein n=1 Tax=Roseateles sp. SL47 TaxID=2995138 RepID=UPI002271EA0B|nr:hypothetical protein [Roseateles sp. SL47]WAC74954.1 hypothetical protein OU995_09760 [Roseateles sp. SL47]